MQPNENLVSLNELAKEIGVNKSTLSYYVSLKLLTPVAVVGRMQVFKKIEALQRYKKIKEKQKGGMTLKDITYEE